MKSTETKTPLSGVDLALLDYLLEDEDIKLPEQQKISSRENKESAPLSFAQQRLWFLEQFEPGSPTYNIPGALRMVGVLDVTALEQSLNEIIRRHEVLRTTFAAGSDYQVISPSQALSLPVIDLQTLSNDSQQAKVDRLIDREGKLSFDLQQGPLLRVTLLKLSDTEHILLFVIHHIAFDGWSRGVLIAELTALYQAFHNGLPSPLPELDIQYADFAEWQRRQGEEAIAQQLSYWQQQLGGSLPVLQLPTDRPRSPQPTFQGATKRFEVSAEIAQGLKQLSQSQGVTLFMTLMAAFNTLLYRYSNQDNICVGSPIANRTRSEIEPLIGFFVNTLVMRTDLSGNPSFLELLKRVRRVALDAYANQEVPFELLVEKLQPARHLNYSPLFQVMFILQNASTNELKLPGLTWSHLDIDSGTSKFDFMLYMSETPSGLEGVWEYTTDLFDAETVDRTIGQFQTLLAGIVADATKRICDFSLLTAAQRHQLLVEWNDTGAEYPRDKCIHQLFEAQVERSPDAVAVIFENERLTYRELNCRADELAHRLRQLGAEPGSKVGICVERSIEMLVGLLGILKTGSAYIPLDPTYPQERLEYMLEDSGASLLLTQQQLVAHLPKNRSRVVCLDALGEQDSSTDIPGASDLANIPRTENLAYIIYTSGSTGKPKGVQISHRALVNFLISIGKVIGATDGDVFLSVTTLSFDIAGLELYLPLILGSRVAILSQQVRGSGTLLAEAIGNYGATIVQATPATWQMLIAGGWSGRVEKILCGGEALSGKLVEGLLDRCDTLWNLYGPTETTIWSTCYEVKSQNSPVPIGRPLANTQIYILDPHLQPQPIGVPGDLYIGGDGLAKGYLNRPELTQKKFISNPFENRQSDKIYKTGDLARYLPDGNVEYLGRSDHQVKIRGFRMELGEIEAILSQHPEVMASAVKAREDGSGSKSLVGYVVPRQEISVDRLRNFLLQKLPEYMVPSVFLMIEAMPLTPNGKIDRRALTEPDSARPELENAFAAPRTAVEEIVTDIWLEVLGLDKVGIHDNFFQLGGHSLLATQVISRIRQAFQVELPVRSLFESPTIAELSQCIKLGNSEQISPKILPVVRDRHLPLSFPQQRLWFVNQLNPETAASYNMTGAVNLTGTLNLGALEQSFQEILRRHEVLRSTFQEIDGQPVQVIGETTLTLPIIDWSELPPEARAAEVRQMAIEDARQPFDLGRGPLLRTTLIKLDPKEHVLLVAMHHIISDAWSLGVFIREFAALYQAFCAGKPSPLPELSIQYADFACWQHQWLQGEVLDNLLSYWQKQLAGAPARLTLPQARKQPPAVGRDRQGGSQSLLLSSAQSAELKILSRQEGVTLFMTLLAGFQTLLHRYTNQDDILVGTDVANRNRAETEGIIGFFINLLVMRANFSGNPSFRELLKQVREVALGAYAHQDLPFGKLVEVLRPDRATSQTPLFQVLFVFQNAPMPALELDGLTVTPLELDTETVKFDIVLFVEETEQGIALNFKYNTALFEASTITRLSSNFEILLGSIVENPETPIQSLEMLSETEKKQQIAAKSRRQQAKFKKFKAVKPKAVNLPEGELILTGYLAPGQNMPFVVKPKEEDMDLADWARANRDFIETNLLKHGAILFRGFNIDSASKFEKAAQGICPNLFEEYGDLPREGASNKVYHSTPYPEDKTILFHNESSHLHRWPQKILFCCLQPAQQGGETPIFDSRTVYQMLPPAMREKFEQKQLMYVRNFIEDLDVSWQYFFRTTDKAEVEKSCHQAGMEFQWLGENHLKTSIKRPAVAKHPKTGELVFFNQVQLHHISCLDPEVRKSLYAEFGEENLPRNVYYGDGSPIEDAVMEELGAIFQQAQVSSLWQKGDIIMLDNMLAAHARNPYVGPRKIVVAMADLISSEDI